MKKIPGPKAKGLSPSSLQLYLNCQRKYWHYKVNKTEKDSGEEDRTALDIGSVFHLVLETLSHNLETLKYTDIISASRKVVSENASTFVENHGPLIAGMLKSYRPMHQESGLKLVKCELEISTQEFHGFVDAIMQDDKGWWIVDMKTAASFSKMLPATLSRHLQLNLYTSQVNEIVWLLDRSDITVENFLGCRYRLTTKTKLKRKAAETTAELINRTFNSVSSYDFEIDKVDMDPESAITILRTVNNAIGSRKKPKEKFCQNFGNCTIYFRPCEYFSQCHGKEYSDEY